MRVVVRFAALTAVLVAALPGVASADVALTSAPPAFPAVRVLDGDLAPPVAPLHLDAAEQSLADGGGSALRTAGDVLLVATIAQAAVIDSLLVPLVRDEPDLALRASLAHSVALGLTMSVAAVFESMGGPYGLQAGMAFTSAGFSCAMHLSRHLYDDPGADLAACGASLAMAAAAGALGAVGDRQHVADVVVGSALGLVVGYLVPLAIVPERSRVPDAALARELEEDEPMPVAIGSSISATPMVSTPSSTLAPEHEAVLRGGSAGAQIGPGTSGAGPGAGLGSAIGLKVSGTF